MLQLEAYMNNNVEHSCVLLAFCVASSFASRPAIQTALLSTTR